MVAGKVKVSRQKRPAEPSWAEYSLRPGTGQTAVAASVTLGAISYYEQRLRSHILGMSSETEIGPELPPRPHPPSHDVMRCA